MDSMLKPSWEYKSLIIILSTVYGTIVHSRYLKSFSFIFFDNYFFNIIKHNIFNLALCVSQPFYKKVTDFNHKDIKFPPATNGKIDIIIINHVSYMDMFISIACSIDRKPIVIAGEALKKITGLELYDNNVFIIEKGMTKEEVCENFLEFLTNKNSNLDLIGLSPEGHIITDEKLKKSNDFCKAVNVQPFTNLLYPCIQWNYFSFKKKRTSRENISIRK